MRNPFISVKKSWDAYLKRLAATNERLYGGERLDCCDLNHKTGKSSSDVQPNQEIPGDNP